MKSVLWILLITAWIAPIASADEPATAPESLDRFLSGVRDFAGGKLTPGPLYDPQSVGLPPGGGAIHVIGASTSMNYTNISATPSWRAANGRLVSGSIMRYTIAPAPIYGQTIVRQNVLPQRITQQRIVSPWGR
jgi:hypothetical protein